LAEGVKPTENLEEVDLAVFENHEFSCDTPFFYERCPKTCGICTPCDNGFEDLDERIIYLVTAKDPVVIGIDVDSEHSSPAHKGLMHDDNLTPCYATGLNPDEVPWAELYLDNEYRFESISFFNADTSYPVYVNANEISVYACTEKQGVGCTLCGRYTENTASTWLKVICDSNVVGSTIRFQSSGADKRMVICEVDYAAFAA
jgi:hypothetical protein